MLIKALGAALAAAIVGGIYILIHSIKESAKQASFKRKATRLKALVESKSIVTNYTQNSKNTKYRITCNYSINSKTFSSFLDIKKRDYDDIDVGDYVWIYRSSEQPIQIIFDCKSITAIRSNNTSNSNEEKAALSSSSNEAVCATSHKIKFCRRCGAELVEGNRFCGNCGNQIEEGQ